MNSVEETYTEYTKLLFNFCDRLISCKKIIDLYEEETSFFINKKLNERELLDTIALIRAIEMHEGDIDITTLDIEENELNRVDYFHKKIVKKIKDNKSHFNSNDPYAASLLQKYKIKVDLFEIEKQQQFNLMILSVAAAYEVFTNELIKYNIMNIYDNDYLKKSTVSYEEIKSLESIVDVKSVIVDNYVNEIAYKSFKDKTEIIFEECCSLNKKKLVKNQEISELISKLTEVFQRRNVITHNDNTVNSIYLKNTTSFYYNKDTPKLDEQLKINANYVREAIEATMLMGSIIFSKNVKSKKIYKHIDSIENLKELHDLCLKLMNNGYHEAAINIEKEMERLEKDDFLVNFNISLAYKLQGKDSLAIKQLEEYKKTDAYEENKNHIQVLFGMDAILLSEEEGVESAIEFINSIGEKHQKINALEMTIFTLFNENDKFVEFTSDLYYS